MPATARACVLAPDIEEQLCLLVRERTGIRILDHQMDTLRRTVTEGLSRFGHAGAVDYLAALRATRASSPEHEHLIAGITVGESYFFRDQTQMAWLREQWLPRLIARRRAENNLSLRVWSAGSSDGQELYSVAMLLAEQLPDLERWNLHLLGTDINAESLARALRGRYSDWSLRATPEAARLRHFRQEKERVWSISAALRGHVHFAYLNLREDSFPSMLSETTALDLILCRNVFIYFDPVIVTEVMRKFHACLVPGGHLLLGASDLVDSGTLDGFTLHSLDNAFYLQSHAPAPMEEAARDTTPARPRTPARVDTDVVAKPAPSPREAPTTRYEDITRLLGHEAWHEALEAISRQAGGDESALPLQFRAKALANLGRAREALEACDASLALDSGDKHCHFLRALILLEMHRLPAAEESLRRTLFLDRNFVEAHYQLGLLQMRRGARESGLKSMKNALAIADRAQPDRRLHDAAGRDHERMAAILRHELRMYESDTGYRK